MKEFWFYNEEAATQASNYVQSFIAETTEDKFISTAGYEITKEKICNLLKPNTWLCDQMVNTSIENIQFDDDLMQLTDSFFYSELVSLNDRLTMPKWKAILQTFKTWIIPINLDLHWSLILLRNKADEIEVECWDSLPTQARIDKIKSQLLSSYKRSSMITKTFSISYKPDCYIQSDLHNCGVFLIGNIFAFINNKNSCNLDLKNSRVAIARLILTSIEPS